MEDTFNCLNLISLNIFRHSVKRNLTGMWRQLFSQKRDVQYTGGIKTQVGV